MHVYMYIHTHRDTYGAGQGYGSDGDILGREAREELTDKMNFE